jgi:hypothetical protein
MFLRKTLLAASAVCLVAVGAPPPTLAGEGAAPDIASLTWLAGTRHIVRDDGTIAYETWTGPSGGVVSGAVAAAIGSGFVEFFRIMPNEEGVYGLFVANSNDGLDKWSFSPLSELVPGRIVFAQTDGSSSFSIESTPDGGIHNVATRMVDGQSKVVGEWYWLPYPPAEGK